MGRSTGAQVARRPGSSRLDQAAADREGYAARDQYDRATAEEWACRTLFSDASVDDPAALAEHIKPLFARDEYGFAGVNDDKRFERHVGARPGKSGGWWRRTRGSLTRGASSELHDAGCRMAVLRQVGSTSASCGRRAAAPPGCANGSGPAGAALPVLAMPRGTGERPGAISRLLLGGLGGNRTSLEGGPAVAGLAT